ncbi:MAG: formylmethionine deformylase, peptide deformylase [Candidatus Peregrinibacteria bacterium GW2011_GWF2_38_29]|nr:MAG: formylmethionine deformylase, peptide deformylase [Candidatus Peregrinibacteria bacterium GW2011_GWF2_38_29]HBB03098.1 peptide deformylase [Candidatus Peregrinibacteria bacterium]
MAKLKILTGTDNKILRTKSVEIKPATKLTKLIKDMKDTLDEKDLGLAAPQVGENVRMCLIRLNPSTKSETLVFMINPKITEMGREKEIGEEGCLSLPGIWVNVERAKNITVKFLDTKGKEQILMLERLNARIIQHEVDHLDGILMVDREVFDTKAALS